jgi:hypothetical protein
MVSVLVRVFTSDTGGQRIKSLWKASYFSYRNKTSEYSEIYRKQLTSGHFPLYNYRSSTLRGISWNIDRLLRHCIPYSYSLFHIGWVCCSSSFQRLAEGTLDYWTTAYVALTAFHWYWKKICQWWHYKLCWCTTCYPITSSATPSSIGVKEWIGKRWKLDSFEL